MNRERLTETALKSVDTLGYQLDRLGITSKVNRHNIAAFMMAEQHHLEGEWESLQARLERYRRQASDLLEHMEKDGTPLLRPVAGSINRLRHRERSQAD